MSDKDAPHLLTDDEIREVSAIKPQQFISETRLLELVGLADRGYGTSAVLMAVREAVWALRNQKIVGPTARR